MNNYKGHIENFTASVASQGAAKQVTEIVDVFEPLFKRELIDKIVEETNRYTEQLICRCILSNRSTARAWKPVAEEEIYVVMGLFMLMLASDHISPQKGQFPHQDLET
jgi:hypothetical protein